MTFLSGFSEIIKDGADLSSGEILAMGVIAGVLQLLAELGYAVDPTHQVAGGGARVAFWKVEHCKLLLAVTADFHFYQKLKLKSLFAVITYFSKITPSLFTIKEGSTSHPKPLSPQKRGGKPLLSIVFMTPSVPLVGDRNVALNRCALRLADHQRSRQSFLSAGALRCWV